MPRPFLGPAARRWDCKGTAWNEADKPVTTWCSTAIIGIGIVFVVLGRRIFRWKNRVFPAEHEPSSQYPWPSQNMVRSFLKTSSYINRVSFLFPRFSSFGKVKSDRCWRSCCTLSDGKRNNNMASIIIVIIMIIMTIIRRRKTREPLLFSYTWYQVSLIGTFHVFSFCHTWHPVH